VVPWDHVGYGTNGYALRQQLSLASMELVGVHVFVIDRVLYSARVVLVFVFLFTSCSKIKKTEEHEGQKSRKKSRDGYAFDVFAI
jgi:uncharacterized membrane protein